MAPLLYSLALSSVAGYTAVEIAEPIFLADRPAALTESRDVLYFRKTSIGTVVVASHFNKTRVVVPYLRDASFFTFGRSRADRICLTGWSLSETGPITEISGVATGDLQHLSELPPPAGYDFVKIAAINANGTSACTATTVAEPQTGARLSTAYVYRNGRFQDIFPGTTGSYATDVNARGDVVGYQMRGVPRAFLFERGKVRFLRSPAEGALALAINQQGIVVGTSEGRHTLYVWNGKTTAGKTCPSEATIDCAEINTAGVIAISGSYLPARAYLFRRGKFQPVDSLVRPAGSYAIDRVLGLNDHGDILTLARRGGKSIILLLRSNNK